MNDADFIRATIDKGDYNSIARPLIEAAQRIRLTNDVIKATLRDVEVPAEPGPHMKAIAHATDLPFTGDKATDYRMLADHMLKAQCAMLKDALGEEKAQPLIAGLIATDKDERMMFDVLGKHELVERLKKGEMSPREISDAVRRMIPARPQPSPPPERLKKGEMSPREISDAVSRMIARPQPSPPPDNGPRYTLAVVGAFGFAAAVVSALLYFFA
jgi:Trp operon repressor